MSVRCATIIASICLSLTAAIAQQREPPLFQGIMVDSKGKTIGRIIGWNPVIVARQISGVWVALPALVDGLEATDPNGIGYFFRSADCAGPRYMQVTNLPVQSAVATIPPATQPSVFFPGTPVSFLSIASQMYGTTCEPVPVRTVYVGPVQSVPVSTLGLTPPFTVK